MRKVITTLIIICLAFASISLARDYRPIYRIGPVYGLCNTTAGEKPNYTYNHALGLSAGLNGERFLFNISLLLQNSYSDSSASGHFGFFANKDNSTLLFKSVRLGFDIDTRLMTKSKFCPTIGAGIGYLVWNIKDPVADSAIKAVDENNITVDFNAAEMFISGSLGLDMHASDKLSLHLKSSYDYLTGIGTSFDDASNSNRPRSQMRFTLVLSYLFGKSEHKEMLSPFWASRSGDEKKDLSKTRPEERDSDGDGISDRDDKCPNTPRGAYIDEEGCPKDADGDGIFDGMDDCPETPPAAKGFVDIHGCPIDSDYDGIPDYLDRCRSGPIGALVDEFGCPTDGDGDGVYDGLDDCPATQPGIEVDERGCIDVSFINKPYLVNVDYRPGSFELDPRTKERLKPLISKLKILNQVKITINGYTDNVGPAEANQTVSQRRANRMRDWLESEGISRDRMTAVGKGETNFLTSNDTADGRAKNRRIELWFRQ